MKEKEDWVVLVRVMGKWQPFGDPTNEEGAKKMAAFMKRGAPSSDSVKIVRVGQI